MPKAKAKSRTKTRVVTSKRSRLHSRPLAIVAAVLFGLTGVYLLVQSYALPPDEVLLPDNAARGLVYEGKKVKTKGPCAGAFDLTTEEDKKIKKNGKVIPRCAHLDPTPQGVDIRERIKRVDQEMVELVEKDKRIKPAKTDDPISPEESSVTAATISGSNMNDIGARDWPCIGDGSNGPRVRLIYVYAAGGDNRLPALRDNFSAIARRVNSVYFASGYESGNGHQVRYRTNNGEPGCNLAIAAEGIRGDKLNDWQFIKERLAERGYRGIPVQYDLTGDGKPDTTIYEDRKYLIWVDKEYRNNKGQLTKCGIGEMRLDDSHGQHNSNNRAVTYAWVWKGCWNYAEPHELGHMLGAVQGIARLSDGTLLQRGTPNSTDGNHCTDEDDLMCYDDDGTGPVNMRHICGRAIDKWRLDCNHNDYYRGNDPASGYLSNHWNVANSQFLTR